MGDKVFKSNIRLKYNYDRDKVGNTVFRPYVYDSSGTSDTMSSSFLGTELVHPLNVSSYKYELSYNVGNKDNYSGGRRYFLFFKGTNGVNSMFSASNLAMVSDIAKINRTVRIPDDIKTLNDYIIAKHDLRFDRGTLKYKDKYNNIYTVEGLGNFSSETMYVDRGNFYGYGEAVSYDSLIIDRGGKNANRYITPDIKVFKNNGYSCFMLLVHFVIRLKTHSGDWGTFTMYCFVPVCFYDLGVLNNGDSSSNWGLGAKLNSGDNYSYSSSISIQNMLGTTLDERVWGGNGINLSNGKITNNLEYARSIPDVYWTTPNGRDGTRGNFLSSNYNANYSNSSPFVEGIPAIKVTAYHMSEMSYKYYMYGEGQSQWRGKEGNMTKYMVKWYPSMITENANLNYFIEHPYIY